MKIEISEMVFQVIGAVLVMKVVCECLAGMMTPREKKNEAKV